MDTWSQERDNPGVQGEGWVAEACKAGAGTPWRGGLRMEDIAGPLLTWVAFLQFLGGPNLF